MYIYIYRDHKNNASNTAMPVFGKQKILHQLQADASCWENQIQQFLNPELLLFHVIFTFTY